MRTRRSVAAASATVLGGHEERLAPGIRLPSTGAGPRVRGHQAWDPGTAHADPALRGRLNTGARSLGPAARLTHSWSADCPPHERQGDCRTHRKNSCLTLPPWEAGRVSRRRTREPPPMPRIVPVALAITVAAGAGVAWHQVSRPAQADTPAAPAPAMPVPVAPVLVRELAETAEFTGVLTAARSVEVRPRVGGMIEAVAYREGDHVEAGDVLFRTDKRPPGCRTGSLARGRACDDVYAVALCRDCGPRDPRVVRRAARGAAGRARPGPGARRGTERLGRDRRMSSSSPRSSR